VKKPRKRRPAIDKQQPPPKERVILSLPDIILTDDGRDLGKYLDDPFWDEFEGVPV
jgi:hypothetical protein